MTVIREPWHCCVDCNNDNHNSRCDTDNNQRAPNRLSVRRFLAQALNERCPECDDAISPLELLKYVEL